MGIGLRQYRTDLCAVRFLHAACGLGRNDKTFNCANIAELSRYALFILQRAQKMAVSFETAIFSILEGSLAHAGDLALVRQLTEADTADAVVAQVSVGTAADLAAVVGAGGELRRGLLFENHRFLSHCFVLLSSRTGRPSV